MLTSRIDFGVRFGGRLEKDSEGRLFDRRMREQLQRMPLFERHEALVPAEALRAVVLAARNLRYTGERWAERYNLSTVRFELLMLLRHHPDEQLTLGQLAKGLDLSPRTVTSLADVLERDGLIRRMPHATDRRAVLARITPEGRARVDALWAEAFERHFPIFEGFTEDEIAQLRHLCFKLLDNLTNGSA
ncbi:MAG: MarR family transcriptional regulator [Chloroflexi bacterium]|nr:MAG: MarR family transcriptional regulator [Chloroflexota bacterium]